MDIESVKSSIVNNVYHINRDENVALHKHDNHDEVFYCMKGEGYGVLEENEVVLSQGEEFVVPAGVMHALRTDSELYVESTLIPVDKD